MNHDQAWQRLPALLDDRDDAALLDHVRECPACQRQLFVLGRIDRMLRRGSPEPSLRGRLGRKRRALAAAGALTVAAAVAAALVVFLSPPPKAAAAFTLRTSVGKVVGEATIATGDAQNASLTLAGRDLPAEQGPVFVLWASDGAVAMPVGRFMVDRDGDCRVRFNLPESHAWDTFWVARRTGRIIARSRA